MAITVVHIFNIRRGTMQRERSLLVQKTCGSDSLTLNTRAACHSILLKMASTKGPVYAGLGWEKDNLWGLEARVTQAEQSHLIWLHSSQKGLFPLWRWSLKLRNILVVGKEEKPWGPDTCCTECSPLSVYECVKQDAYQSVPAHFEHYLWPEMKYFKMFPLL